MNTVKKNKFKLQSLTIVVILSLAGVFAGYFLGKLLKHTPEFTQHIEVLAWWDLLILPFSFLLVLAIHEAGHLLGGFSRGMRFLLYIVGPFQFSQTQSGIRFNWIFNLGTFGGLAAATPDPNKPLRPQLLNLIAGGPLASLVLTIICFASLLIFEGRFATHLAFIGILSLFIFIVTAIPSQLAGMMSDGKQFLEVIRGGDAVVVRQRFSTLIAQSMAGIRPREWDADWLEPATQNSTDIPMRQVAIRQLAMLAAQDRGDFTLADNHADWLSENYEDYPLGFRQSLTIELCLYALKRDKFNAAKIWMAQSKGGVVDKSRRYLAEAELAFIEGNKPVALGKHMEAYKQLKNSIDPGVAQLTKERLDLLMAKLAGKPSSKII